MQKDTCSIMFIAALFIIDRSWKEPRCLSKKEWVQKMWYIYTMEFYLAIKNNEFKRGTWEASWEESVCSGESSRPLWGPSIVCFRI